MAGIILTDHADIEMRESDARMLIQIEDTMRRLHLGFFCLRCQALGNPDGVQAKNHPGDQTWAVTCGCSTRKLHRAR